MDNFSRPDSAQITVTLISENKLLRLYPFDARSHSSGPAMGCFADIDPDIIIKKNTATHSRHANSTLCQT